MLLPACLIAVILALPRPWETQLYDAPVLTLDLSQDQVNEPNVIAPIEPKMDEPLLEEPLPDEPLPAKPLPNEPLAIKPPATEPLTAPPTDTPPAKTTTTVNATDILRMLQNRPAMELTPEFQARTTPSKDFYIPEQQIIDWYADIPFLDESIDKPQLQMRFYPEGFEGSIEKFFDKVTYRKTFTTKYGTKIHCALIAGVLAACSWK